MAFFIFKIRNKGKHLLHSTEEVVDHVYLLLYHNKFSDKKLS